MKNLKQIFEKENDGAWQGIMANEPKERRYKRLRRGKVSHRGSLNKRKLRVRSNWEEYWDFKDYIQMALGITRVWVRGKKCQNEPFVSDVRENF